MVLRPRSSFALMFVAALATTAGCGQAPSDLRGDSEDALGAGAQSARADADAEGKVSVRAGTLTLSFDGRGELHYAGEEPRLRLRGRSSRNLNTIRSFVPDDAFGEVSLTSARTFEVVLRGGHEINTILSGLPLRLSIETKAGSPRRYEAALHVGARFESAGTSIRVGAGALSPVWTGEDALRYRARVETTKTPSAVTASSDRGAAEVLKRSARRFDVDFAFEQLPLGEAEQASFVATWGSGSKAATETARVSMQVALTALALTTDSIDASFPEGCEPAVRRCIDRAGADVSTCGSYRAVGRCRDEPPPPDPQEAAMAKRIGSEVSARTGVSFEPSILSWRAEGGRNIALVSVGNGSAEFAVPTSTSKAVELVGFTDRPIFVDEWTVQRFQKQLGQVGLSGGTIVAHGMPNGGNAPVWHLVVARGGTRSTVALQATSESRSVKISWTYDEGAFRSMAPALLVESALDFAKEGGVWAELEVYLRSIQRFSTSAGLTLMTASTSPVGLDARNEAQLEATSLWGDNAFYITIHRTSGAIRVEHFN